MVASSVVRSQSRPKALQKPEALFSVPMLLPTLNLWVPQHGRCVQSTIEDMKDNFSAQSERYAQFRPTYPLALFEFLNLKVEKKEAAWDCGTGTGQVACELAKTFDRVFASDISQQQIANAPQAENIFYSVQPAEETSFESELFDLVVVAQAIHWFDFDRFYSEVRRTAKEGALLCVIGYGRLEISENINRVISDFYNNAVGAYWDEERRYVDDNYETIPFPFEEIPKPNFSITCSWALEHLIGYLNTWSAVKHFIKKNGFNPVDELALEIEKYWGKEQTRQVRFPLFLRVGRVDK